MEIWAAIIGAVVGIGLTSAFSAIRNKYVVRSVPLVAMRSSSSAWTIRNRSSTRIFLSGVSYDDDQNRMQRVNIPASHAFLVRGHEVAATPIPDGVLVRVFWEEAPALSNRVRYRTGDFFTKSTDAECVVTPREMSPHGGK